MEYEMSGLDTAIKAKSSAFGNYIDPQRELFDAQQLALVERQAFGQRERHVRRPADPVSGGKAQQ